RVDPRHRSARSRVRSTPAAFQRAADCRIDGPRRHLQYAHAHVPGPQDRPAEMTRNSQQLDDDRAPPVRTRRATIGVALGLAAFGSSAGVAMAQRPATWPSKPVRMIVPFPPASTSDVIARVLGQKLGQRLGQPFVIDNRVGASGNIGADLIAKAAPDGYTIGFVTSSTQAVAVGLTARLPYDPLTDFTPIAMVAKIGRASCRERGAVSERAAGVRKRE